MARHRTTEQYGHSGRILVRIVQNVTESILARLALKQNKSTGVLFGIVAQMVERRPEEPSVTSSNLVSSTKLFYYASQ